MTEPRRVTFDLLPELTPVLMYAALIVFGLILAYGVYRRASVWFRGKPNPDLSNLPERLRRTFLYAIGQRKVVKHSYAGVMHTLLYSGIVVLFIGTTLVFFDYDIFLAIFQTQFLRGNFYLLFELALDAFGIFAIAGLIIAGYRRFISKPKNLETIRDDSLILAILLVICVSGFVMEGIRLAIRKPDWAAWSFVGARIARFILESGTTDSTLSVAYQGLWWFHAILAFLGISLIPYTKLWHLITSPLNAFFQPIRAKGELSTPFDLRELMKTGQFDVRLGVSSVGDFTWRQRLSFDSCTVCGRCSNACPATAAGTPLSPMHVVLKVRDLMLDEVRRPNGRNLHGEAIDAEELWACTTCRACVQECPVLIDHIDAIVDMRRYLVAEGKLDRKKRDLLTNLNNVANPYGLPANDRAKWTEGLPVRTVKEQGDFEVLYWVGCAGSFDPRNQNVSKAMVALLNAAGVKFSILGNEERCNCEVARRLGEESRFQQTAVELVEIFKRYNVKRIVTQCPHCFNTFKNEYPKFGLDADVVHHTQFLKELIESGRLRVREGKERTVTFHDPCYLGRFNDLYDEPREVIMKAGPVRLVEMERCRERSFCCGAGGANFWYTVQQKEKVNAIRFEEAKKTGADILGTACPFCTSMFEDAAQLSGASGKVVVRDIAEILTNLVD